MRTESGEISVISYEPMRLACSGICGEESVGVERLVRGAQHPHVGAEIFGMGEPSVEPRENARAERVFDCAERRFAAATEIQPVSSSMTLRGNARERHEGSNRAVVFHRTNRRGTA